MVKAVINKQNRAFPFFAPAVFVIIFRRVDPITWLLSEMNVLKQVKNIGANGIY